MENNINVHDMTIEDIIKDPEVKKKFDSLTKDIDLESEVQKWSALLELPTFVVKHYMEMISLADVFSRGTDVKFNEETLEVTISGIQFYTLAAVLDDSMNDFENYTDEKLSKIVKNRRKVK